MKIESKKIFAPNGAVQKALDQGKSEAEIKEVIILHGHDAGEFVESEVNSEETEKPSD